LPAIGVTAKQLLALPAEKVGRFIERVTTKRIPLLASAAAELDRRIKEDQALLEKMKERLTAEARADYDAARLQDPAAFLKIEGTSWSFKGDCGRVAEVSFPEDGLLRSGFWLVDDMAFTMREKRPFPIGKVREVCGVAFSKLFNTFYRPKKSFDDVAGALFDESQRAELFKMVKEPQSPRVNFRTAKKD
jgi:hypothetical protein